MNIQAWFALGLTGLTSLLSKGLSKVFSKEENLKKKKKGGWGESSLAPQFEASILGAQPSS